MFNKIKNYILYRNNETGRSMVEMLGVLAIIGVLTVGGLAGYNYAMEKNKVNELINGAIKRAVVVAGMGRTGTVSLDEFSEDTIAAGTFGNTATVSGGKITLTVSGVEEKICDRLKATIGENAVMAVVEECGTDPLTLAFNHDLQKGSVADIATNIPTSISEKLETLEEFRECEDDADCTGPCEQCTGRCTKIMDGSNGCTACVDGEFSVEWIGGGTACYSCNLNVYDIPPELCNQCSNREYDSTKNMCVFKNCPTGYELRDGQCFEICQSGYVKDIDKKCRACNETAGFIEVNNDSDCESVCDNRILIESGEISQYFCMIQCNTGYILNLNGECVSCDESSGDEIMVKETWGRDYCGTQCSNREGKSPGIPYNGYRKKCVLK